ncbi:resistance protein [Trifolium pratense]|uniref:Resistance protein n=1 Tax=Trifolium pratense TaxID=57577 RepID=A0A2K3N555_TRIPR|nr:resistance protein [Trifolium pratense]
MPKLALPYLPYVEIIYASGETVDDGASFLPEIAASISLKSWLQRPTNLTCLERIEIAICPDLILPATMNMLTSLCQVRIYDEDKNGTLPNFLEEKTMSLWKKSKQFLRRHQDYYHSEDESDNIIDDDL